MSFPIHEPKTVLGEAIMDRLKSAPRATSPVLAGDVEPNVPKKYVVLDDRAV